MAGSIADNAAIYKKKPFTYVPPAPPAELIESTSYTLDFTARKFVLVGIDPTEQFQTVIILLTSSRYVKISIDFLRRIFSLMGNVLSFILDTPQNYKRTIFLETDSYKISSMVYSGSNVLVIESKTEDGCRVLLNRIDLIKLQELEWCITASIKEKEEKIKPEIIKQISDYCEYLSEKCLQSDSPPNNLREMEIFIRNVEVRQSKKTPNLGQIKMFATTQLAELCMAHRKVQDSKVTYDKNFKTPSYFSPNYSIVEEGISKLCQEIDACDEINPLENDLVEDGYSPISIISSLHDDSCTIRDAFDKPEDQILAKPLDHIDGPQSPSSSRLFNIGDGFDFFNRFNSPPSTYANHPTAAPLRRVKRRLPQSSTSSQPFDEDDGSDFFNSNHSLSQFTTHEPSDRATYALQPTPLRNVKRRLF
ncbi:unnamed protein product [Macrosiphum euphorbiae]|uniref:Uncharacterized protein n=1 Tax=Macrosiphum euphorbiae TaxID=13131 RepID=A0AAV0XWA4_9HEMI|nr:unnamed protein product [Macrosiphum euphorbiae]CAI6372728.1 unnamed protein product [Macrosiphum euphorbiae]CAI6375327.1 unnamed protein product [Macrosiphum euphorbiae]